MIHQLEFKKDLEKVELTQEAVVEILGYLKELDQQSNKILIETLEELLEEIPYFPKTSESNIGAANLGQELKNRIMDKVEVLKIEPVIGTCEVKYKDFIMNKERTSLRLLGAREMLKEPAGKFFEHMWWDRESCLKVIDDFKINPLDCRKKGDLAIFVNNGSSAKVKPSTKDLEDGDVILYHYDLNIVGDANPLETLYLVYDDETLIQSPYSLEVLQRVRNKFIVEAYSDFDHSWAFKAVEAYHDEITTCNLSYTHII